MEIEMITPETIQFAEISYNELSTYYARDFLKPFEKLGEVDFKNGMYLNFNIQERENNRKINPLLKIAIPENAQEIVDMCNEAYEGTYPYREMLDIEAVREKINGLEYHWFLFKDTKDNTMGCFKFHLNFEERKGYLGGFTVKKKYQGSVDVVKAMIGMMIGMINKYKEEIMMWYCENRTAHSKTQFMVLLCGLRPVAFYPNKDVFFNNVESDLMEILYDERVLRNYRTNQTPEIIPEVKDCFDYSNDRYELGLAKIVSPDIKMNLYKVLCIKKKIIKEVVKDKYGYEEVKISLKDSDSYFKFLYTPTVKNFEKTIYKIKNIEELFVLVQEFKNYAKELNIRYYEVFVSAYEPEHQKIFLESKLSPRGYVPSWKYNQEKDIFEDYILFNHYEGEIDRNIQLIPEGEELIRCLNLR